MRVIVCGGRNFHDYEALENYLDMLHTLHVFTLVIHGDARGADTLAKYWAGQRHIDSVAYPADWKLHPRGGGVIRNKRMLDEATPDMVIAFPGGNGTKDMREQGTKAGLPVLDLRDAKVREKIRQDYGVRGGRRGGADTPP